MSQVLVFNSHSRSLTFSDNRKTRYVCANNSEFIDSILQCESCAVVHYDLAAIQLALEKKEVWSKYDVTHEYVLFLWIQTTFLKKNR